MKIFGGKNFLFTYEQCNEIRGYDLKLGDIFTIPFSVYLKTPGLWTSSFEIVDINKIRFKRKFLWFWIPKLTKTIVITLQYIKRGENYGDKKLNSSI